ncbi:hypothetical protein E1B28_010468 [Marasmius oreades]|uniref:Uncharacterized protein n=1 Tax=Marasmius oreades TaxID=181124 RepID=A0A9P7RXV5_9AGAR|nr:uncharacterized protein E1B28_010468 [Marasmius oreades]KAG7091432.1 hypothetical protein E1B28_010468 [Marasmius oreades]
MAMNEIVMDNLERYFKENENGALKCKGRTVWKCYSANQTLSSIQRAVENSVVVDENSTMEGCKGIPIECLQRMDQHLREAYRKLVLNELPTRPSSSSSSSDDSTPPSTPTEGRSPVMRVARMTDRPLFNPFSDEQDYVEFMLKTASTMAVGAFDPFEDQLHVQGNAVNVPIPIEDDEEAIFHLPSAFDVDSEPDAPHAELLKIMDNEDQPSTEVMPSCNFRDLDRLGRRIPQVELNRTKRKQLQRRSVVKYEVDAPMMEGRPTKSPSARSRYSQYMPTTFNPSDILSFPKKGQMKRHPDEQRLLLRLLLDK